MLSEKNLNDKRKNGIPYLYNKKKKIGENKIAEITKEFACEMGFDIWHKITNHSNRKLGVTTVASNSDNGCLPVLMKSARHKHLSMQLPYPLVNEDMCHNYQMAMVGKHVDKPSGQPPKKKARFSDCEVNSLQCGDATTCDYNDNVSHYSYKPDILSNKIVNTGKDNELDFGDTTSISNRRESKLDVPSSIPSI
jgi:hypothetical protein